MREWPFYLQNVCIGLLLGFERTDLEWREVIFLLVIWGIGTIGYIRRNHGWFRWQWASR